MQYLILIIFWTGVLLLKTEGPYDLKKRAEAYFRKEKDKGGDRSSVFASVKARLHREALIREISESLGYIKNIAVLGRSSEFSAQALLEGLADISVKLKPVYVEMARYLSTGEKTKARQHFIDSTGLGISAGLGELLAGWDDVDPKSIEETLASYQTVLREERITAQKRKNEILSDLIYFPVVINCMIVLLNFIYITFFIGQQDSFTVLF
ncbi:MAG: hypothetical protein J5528_04940 [Firmicutes bacterium]|nr:hypothetical protein [Bacillota bacterium]